MIDYSEYDLDNDSQFQQMIADTAEAGYTDQQLARILGTSRGTIARWRKGQYSPAPIARPYLRDALEEVVEESESKILGSSV